MQEMMCLCFGGLHAGCSQHTWNPGELVTPDSMLPEVWGLSPEEVGPQSFRGPVHPESSWGFLVHAQHATSLLSPHFHLGGLLPPPSPSPLSSHAPNSPTTCSQYLSLYQLKDLAQLSGDLGFRFSSLSARNGC